MVISSLPSIPLTRPVRFAAGLRAFLSVPLDRSQLRATIAEEHRTRDARFLAALDALVWSVPSSPWLRFFEHAGMEAGDVRRLVRDEGLEGALDSLRDAGVYLSTEEATGASPVRRGSTTFVVAPEDLFNPRVVPDFIAGTSGTRSAGTPVAASFRSLRRMAVNLHLTSELWDVVDRPGALWRPALPGSGGLIALLSSSIAGRPPERWFSQLDPQARGLAWSKRLANRYLHVLAWPAHLPRPTHVPADDPAAVLDWFDAARASSDRVVLNVYPSSALRLAQLAVERGTSLDGLFLRLVGEPITGAKANVLRGVAAVPINAYSFAQQGAVATACPHSADEEVHVFEHEVAVRRRLRARPDGAMVDALLWTSLAFDARSVWINVENDDYGSLDDNSTPCACLLGSLGMRTRLRDVRGMSKAVTGGVTLPGPVVEVLTDVVLPARFGGGSADWQLAEQEDAHGAYLEVRADPRLGPLDQTSVAAAIIAEIRATEAGVLAASVWARPGFIRLSRRPPVAAPSGKTLAFELLASARGGRRISR